MKKEKKDFLIYQWCYFVPFSVLAVIGVLIVSIMAILIGVCSLKYLVKSFSLESSLIFPALILTIICLGVVAVLVYSVILLIRKYISSVGRFIEEKKEAYSENN